jgi:hypothetical protein
MQAPCVFLAVALLLSSVGCASSDTARQPTTQQIAELEGVHGLSDGGRARLFGLDNRLYIRLGAHQQKELLAAGPDRYVSRRGEVSLRALPGDRIELAYVRGLGGRAPVRFASGSIVGRGYAD